MAVKFDFASLDNPFEADWPVRVPVPMDDGKVEEQVFSARFRLLRGPEQEAAVKEDKDGNELLRRFFVGFGKTEARQLTPELFLQMVTTPYVRNALLGAWTKFCAGIPEKN